MAGLFSKLYRTLTGRGAGPAPGQSRSAQIREAAAAEHQSRQRAREQIQAETAAGFESLRAKIAAESAAILAGLGKPIAAAAEQQRQQHLERQARAERERVLTPEEQFLAGTLRLLYGRDFQSTNPAKPAVYAVWWVPAEKRLYVTFFEDRTPGPTYRYRIPESEARTMYRYSSKGIGVWDRLRVRGSKTAHRYPYERVGEGGESGWA